MHIHYLKRFVCLLHISDTVFFQTIHDEQVSGHVFNFGSSIYSKATVTMVFFFNKSRMYLT